MAKTNKTKVFKTFDDYMKFNATQSNKQTNNKKGKYYRIGANVAKMACEKSTSQIN